MALALISQVAGCYLVATLATTGLAKLRSWRVASTGVTFEGIFSRRAALPVIIAVSAAELSLAALIVAGHYPVAVGSVTAGVFLLFGGYKVAVAVRTGNVACSCAGTSKANAATLSGITAEVSSSLIQASLACAWAFPSEAGTGGFSIPLLVAFAIPFAAFWIGLGRRNRVGSVFKDHAMPFWPSLASTRRVTK